MCPQKNSQNIFRPPNVGSWPNSTWTNFYYSHMDSTALIGVCFCLLVCVSHRCFFYVCVFVLWMHGVNVPVCKSGGLKWKCRKTECVRKEMTAIRPLMCLWIHSSFHFEYVQAQLMPLLDFSRDSNHPMEDSLPRESWPHFFFPTRMHSRNTLQRWFHYILLATDTRLDPFQF